MPRMTSPTGESLTVSTREGAAALRALGWTDEQSSTRSEPEPSTADEKSEADEPKRRPGRPRKRNTDNG